MGRWRVWWTAVRISAIFICRKSSSVGVRANPDSLIGTGSSAIENLGDSWRRLVANSGDSAPGNDSFIRVK